MTEFDRRITPARPDLAADFLRGTLEAARYEAGEKRRVASSICPLHRAPDAASMQESQLLFGEDVMIYEERDGWCWGQSLHDGYVGYIPAAALEEPGAAPTHRVGVLRTFLYPKASIKDPPLALISLNALVSVVRREGAFAVLGNGAHVHGDHLVPLDHRIDDWVGVAEMFEHTPYLWGGRSSLGLDCSGLVQAALATAGIPAPRDSDMQEAGLGTALPPDLSLLRRGDLVFWKGHVGIMQDSERLLHANGHHMLVVSEPLKEAVKRIAANSCGAVTALKRL